ncbi:SseB family protein [Lysobacter korlensis]|uniref:SseB family protein n=1 Tax=Lysobacter korlensis TaxID=553636 RepID=A0ABV6RYR5_9GAMM
MPWSGRHFEQNTHADDDGSAPEALRLALERFRAGSGSQADVVDAVRGSRLLIPLLAELGEAGVSQTGQTVDKSQELSIVTVAAPDGRNAMPVFSSVDAMRAWNPDARPVPAAGTRVALAAVAEGTDLVVLDPGSPATFVLRRPALWAIGRQHPWQPSPDDREVAAEFTRLTAAEPAIRAIRLHPGDPEARLSGPELLVELTLVDGLDRAGLDALLARLAERFAASELIADRVDSMGVRLARSP